MTGPLLVVAHEGFRNGATRVLASLLRHLDAEHPTPLHVRVQTEGPVAEELRSFTTEPRSEAAPVAVLVNSALAADVLLELPAELPSLVYVHEVGEALQALPDGARRGLLERADRVLCVSEAARSDLVALGVARARIGVVPPLLEAVEPARDDVARAVRDRGLPEGVPLVLGCGEATWRKGTDLFVDLARLLPPEVHLVWVGRRTRAFAKLLDREVELSGCAERVHFVGEVTEPAPLLAAARCFVLTSREDPQPLVPLEAAVAGTPTAGFGGTGLDDLVVHGAAIGVPFPDLRGLALAVERLLGDPTSGEQLIREARAVVARERSWEALAPTLLDEIGALAGGHPKRSVP